jgi:hypothetical protein
MRAWWWSGVVGIGCLAGGACDDAPAPPPPTRSAAPDEAADPATTEPARPTTQQLLSGPRTRVPLATLPLTAAVPEGWEIATAGPLVLLKGPTPAGSAEVQLAHRPPLKRDQIDALIDVAREEHAGRPGARRLDVRPLGAATVLERQRVGAAIPDPVTGEADPIYEWTLTIFVPQDDALDVHELNFVGLTLRQYETDEPLLRSIVESLRLEYVAPGAG